LTKVDMSSGGFFTAAVVMVHPIVFVISCIKAAR
jgi:hypothetical protein